LALSFSGPPKSGKEVADLVRRGEFFRHSLVEKRAREGRKGFYVGSEATGRGGGAG